MGLVYNSLAFVYITIFFFTISQIIHEGKEIKSTTKYVYTEHRELRNVEFNLTPGDIERNTNFPNCPPCQIKNNDPNHKTSTPKDCILCVSVGLIDNIFPFVRSVRTTGCKATIIILFDEKAYGKLTDDIYALFKNCSVNCYNIGHVNKWNNSNSIFAIKHLIAYDFIYKTAYLFDRILLIDLLDVVFQDDPFFEAVDPDALTIIKEARLFKDDSKNVERITPLIKYNKSMASSQVLNAGIFYGSPEILMKFETLYFHCFDINRIDETHCTCDQGHLNYFYVSGILNREFPKLNLWHRDQGFESLASTKDRPNEADLGDIYYLHKRAIIIHMFDRSKDMVKMVERVCPQGSYVVPDGTYTRHRKNWFDKIINSFS